LTISSIRIAMVYKLIRDSIERMNSNSIKAITYNCRENQYEEKVQPYVSINDSFVQASKHS